MTSAMRVLLTLNSQEACNLGVLMASTCACSLAVETKQSYFVVGVRMYTAAARTDDPNEPAGAVVGRGL